VASAVLADKGYRWLAKVVVATGTSNQVIRELFLDVWDGKRLGPKPS
jgi:hypothetical protein